MVSLETKSRIIQKYIDEGYWKKETFGEMLRRVAKKFPDNNAISDGEVTITYAKWDKMVDGMCNILEDKGIKVFDRVILQMPNSINFFVISFALFRMGAIPIFALPAHRGNEIKSFIKVAEPSAHIICKKHLGFDYQSMADECVQGTNCQVWMEDDLISINSVDVEPYEDKANAFETAVLLVSGGTTGIPKLIPRTHADYLYDADTFAKVCKFSEETVYLAAIPAAHNFAFANPGIVGTMLNGGESVMARTGSPDEILELIECEYVTTTAMVPSLLAVCSDMAGWEEFNLESMETILVGGSTVSYEILAKGKEAFDCEIRQVYGTAEGVNCICPEDMPLKDMADCQGRAISEADKVRIIDANGNFLGNGKIGELVLRGPYTILNYYNCEAANEESFMEDGFYKTGDMAFVDEDENLHVIGRLKEQINKAGEKIVPSELEEIIGSHEQIRDVAVIGIDDDELGSKVCVCIVSDADIKLEDLCAFMEKKQIASYKWPDCIFRVDNFPLTAVGKVDKNKLKAMHIG